MSAPFTCLGLSRDPQSPPWTDFEFSDEDSARLSQEAAPKSKILNFAGAFALEILGELVVSFPELFLP
jgi:hypothetical protein